MAELKRRGDGAEPTGRKESPFAPTKDNSPRQIGFSALNGFTEDKLRRPAPGLDGLSSEHLDRMRKNAEATSAALEKLTKLYIVMEADPNNRTHMAAFVDGLAECLLKEPNVAVSLLGAAVAAMVNIGRMGGPEPESE